MTGGTGADADRAANDAGRLAGYEARTEEPLDLLALATLWLVVVLPSEFGAGRAVTDTVYACRFALSAVYAMDIIIRSALAPRHLRYALTHPLALASVIAPPVRVFFSIRLVRSLFRRGNLRRFLLAATVTALNGAAIVYLAERHAPLQHPYPARLAVVDGGDGDHHRLRGLLPGHHGGTDHGMPRTGHRPAHAGGGHRAGGVQFPHPGVQPGYARPAAPSGSA